MRRAATPRTSSLNQLGIFTSTNMGIIYPTTILRVTLLELTDSLLYQTGRRVSDLVRQVYDRTAVRQARSAVEYRQ